MFLLLLLVLPLLEVSEGTGDGGQGLPLDQVVAARGVRRSTVMDHLIKQAESGSPLDWGRLANEEQLGPANSVSTCLWVSPHPFSSFVT